MMDVEGRGEGLRPVVPGDRLGRVDGMQAGPGKHK